MSNILSNSEHFARGSCCSPQHYAVAEPALRRWATQRLRRERRADGGTDFSFALSGSTCNNVPLEVVMTVSVDATGRIESTAARPLASDRGCAAACAAQSGGSRFLREFSKCEELIGLTVAQAAFQDWREEPSGCFCTAGNRRHKWRNVLQTIHYSLTHLEDIKGR